MFLLCPLFWHTFHWLGLSRRNANLYALLNSCNIVLFFFFVYVYCFQIYSFILQYIIEWGWWQSNCMNFHLLILKWCICVLSWIICTLSYAFHRNVYALTMAIKSISSKLQTHSNVGFYQLHIDTLIKMKYWTLNEFLFLFKMKTIFEECIPHCHACDNWLLVFVKILTIYEMTHWLISYGTQTIGLVAFWKKKNLNKIKRDNVERTIVIIEIYDNKKCNIRDSN